MRIGLTLECDELFPVLIEYFETGVVAFGVVVRGFELTENLSLKWYRGDAVIACGDAGLLAQRRRIRYREIFQAGRRAIRQHNRTCNDAVFVDEFAECLINLNH